MKLTASILLLILVMTSCAPNQNVFQPNPFLLDHQPPLIMAHGGAKDLWPENTLPAFEGSFKEYQVDVLEMDVCMTKDEVLVCHHDLTIDARSDGSGPVISYTFDELLAFNFGYNFQPIDQPGVYPYRSDPLIVPPLEVILTLYQGKVRFNIELKNSGDEGLRAAEILQDLLKRLNLTEEVLVASFHDEVIAHFRDITDNTIPTSTGRSETEDFVFSSLGNMEFLYLPDAAAVQVPTSSAGINLATKDIVEAAHRRNMAIHYWTINDKETMRELIELGVDGIITDRPDLLREVLAE